MNQSGFYKIHLLRTHSFLKVTRITPALQMAPLDLKWLREYLAKNPKAIAHQKFGEGDEAQIVLTASTPELRKFIVPVGTPDPPESVTVKVTAWPAVAV